MVKITTRNVLGSVCRSCLGLDNVANMYETSCGGDSVVEAYEEFISSKINNSSKKITKNMCLTCVTLLFQSNKFLKMCKKSLETLEEIAQLDERQKRGDHTYARECVFEFVDKGTTESPSKVDKQESDESDKENECEHDVEQKSDESDRENESEHYSCSNKDPKEDPLSLSFLQGDAEDTKTIFDFTQEDNTVDTLNQTNMSCKMKYELSLNSDLVKNNVQELPKNSINSLNKTIPVKTGDPSKSCFIKQEGDKLLLYTYTKSAHENQPFDTLKKQSIMPCKANNKLISKLHSISVKELPKTSINTLSKTIPVKTETPSVCFIKQEGPPETSKKQPVMQFKTNNELIYKLHSTDSVQECPKPLINSVGKTIPVKTDNPSISCFIQQEGDKLLFYTYPKCETTSKFPNVTNSQPVLPNTQVTSVENESILKNLLEPQPTLAAKTIAKLAPVEPPASVLKPKTLNKTVPILKKQELPNKKVDTNEVYTKTLPDLIKRYREHFNSTICCCFVCNKEFNRKKYIYKHLINFHLIRIKDFTCLKCNKIFNNRQEIIEHCKTEEHLNTLCKLCNVKCKTVRIWRNHLDKRLCIRKGVQPKDSPVKRKKKYFCKKCVKVYFSFQEIMSHFKEMHSNEKSCILCSKVYTKSVYMHYHMQRHGHQTGCKNCRLTFNSTEELQKHCKTPEHQNICSICKRKFESHSKYLDHRQSHENLNRHECDQCHLRYMRKMNLIRHIRRDHEGYRYLCEDCGRCFTVKRNLEDHRRYAHNGEIKPKKNKPTPRAVIFICDQCGQTVKGHRMITLHKASHEFGHTEICFKCHRTYETRADLEQHITDHQLFFCNICPRKFFHEAHLMLHQRTHNNHQKQTEDPTSLRCARCNLQFETKPLYTEHIKLLHNDSFPCGLCEKTFTKRESLQFHMEYHTGNFRYLCSYCGKGFPRKLSLTHHLRTHTDVRPYVCSLCGKSFRQGPHLKAHENMHRGIKPYVCRYCGKAFTHNTSWSTHERIHTGETPYICPVCNKGFNHSSAMKKHHLTHSKSKVPSNRGRALIKMEDDTNTGLEEHIAQDQEDLDFMYKTEEDQEYKEYSAEEQEKEEYTAEDQENEEYTAEDREHEEYTADQEHEEYTAEDQEHEEYTAEQEHEEYTAEDQEHEEYTAEQEHEEYIAEDQEHKEYTAEDQEQGEYTAEDQENEEYTAGDQENEECTAEDQENEEYTAEDQEHEEYTAEDQENEEFTAEDQEIGEFTVEDYENKSYTVEDEDDDYYGKSC